jgi:succinate dehydrogenase / fumarate reductase iron-sulfur subunit
VLEGHPPGQGAVRRLDRHPLLVQGRDLRLVRRAHQRPAGLACHTHLDRRRCVRRRDGVIEVEPMGNMPIIKDLIVDMDAVHWKKIQRVTPWLLTRSRARARVRRRRESMVDVTQSMACIQCGACVSDCLSMEVDPLFIGPAALAKAYRFVGDPRDAQQFERLKDLAEDPTASTTAPTASSASRRAPKGVSPDEPDHAPAPARRRRSPHRGPQQRLQPRARVRQEHRKNGLLHENDLLADSFGGKFHPRAVPSC